MTQRTAKATLALAALTLSVPALAGVKVAGDDDSNLKIGALLQGHAAFTDGGAPDGGLGTDLYLRRMRLMVYGQISPKVNFFVETDNPNFGRNGDWSGSTFIQDAYVELDLHEAFQLDMGMILIPFSHQSFQSATSLATLDYQTATIRYPAGKVWRDAGVLARGLVLDGLLDYRVGVFNGVRGDGTVLEQTDGTTTWTEVADPRNPSDLPRAMGRLTLNVFEPEGGRGVGGFFVDGLYIKKTDAGIESTRKVLSLGVAADFQPGVNATWSAVPDEAGAMRGYETSPYLAVAADVFWDIPTTADNLQAASGQVDFYWYDHGDEGALNSASSGIGVSGNAGYRVNHVQGVVLADFFDSPHTEATDYLNVAGGLGYYMLGHAMAFKLQVGAANAAEAGWSPSGVVLTQLVL